MPVTDPESLFVHELKDILFAERTIEKALPKLANEATNPELKAAIEHHLGETKSHIANLAQIFDSMGMTDRGQACPGILGLMKEHDEFVDENGDAPAKVLDSFLCGAAARTEHYEIAAYTGLIEMARALGETEAVGLLEENLKEEKEALREVESVTKTLRDETKATAS
jgi:ferritin-like metal-binding protein YciE